MHIYTIVLQMNKLLWQSKNNKPPGYVKKVISWFQYWTRVVAVLSNNNYVPWKYPHVRRVLSIARRLHKKICVLLFFSVKVGKIRAAFTNFTNQKQKSAFEGKAQIGRG